ncbi:MAG: RNA methyltransferase substrate-binding domain-containing protein, partial [Rhodanobacter sp.]
MSESWIVGINPVEGALSNDAERVREVLVENGQRNARVLELADRAKKLNIPVRHGPRDELDKRAGEARHQGVVARYEAAPAAHEDDLAGLLQRDGSDTLLLVLDGVTDPHNLGACLRSAAA